MVGERREHELAEATERVVSWFRIIGGVAGVVLTVTDQVVHPPLEKGVEVVSLTALALLGVVSLVWLRTGPDADRLRRFMQVTYTVDALVLLAQAPLHAFVVLESPSPALLVPLLGAVRFGRRGAIAGTIGVALAYVLRGALAVQVYDLPFGVDPAVVSVLLAGIVGGITAHLYDNAMAGRARADAATLRATENAALAAEATARAEGVHRVLADGVGGGVGQVTTRLAPTVLELVEGEWARLTIDDAGDGAVTVVVGEPDEDAPDVERHAVRYGDAVLGELVVGGARGRVGDLPALAAQVGLAVHAARLLDHEAALSARYRALDVMRSNFVALTSHELRTPLAAIVGASETLEEHGESLTTEQRKTLQQLISRQGARLTGLVDDLVTVGRHDAGALDLRPGYVAMYELVDRVSMAVERSLETEGDEAAMVWVDLDRGAQVLANLVENAFEHGSPPVDVRWTLEDDVVRVEVSDAGAGVPAEDRERVFERFVQLLPIEHHSRGTGLGLGISRDLMRAMGGDVLLAEGDGPTTFAMLLPREPVVGQAPEERRRAPR